MRFNLQIVCYVSDKACQMPTVIEGLKPMLFRHVLIMLDNGIVVSSHYVLFVHLAKDVNQEKRRPKQADQERQYSFSGGSKVLS